MKHVHHHMYIHINGIICTQYGYHMHIAHFIMFSRQDCNDSINGKLNKNKTSNTWISHVCWYRQWRAQHIESGPSFVIPLNGI